MSTILKALRRLEREQPHLQRPLRERVVTGEAEPPERGFARARRWRAAAVAAGVAALLAGAWYLGRSSANEADDAPATARPAPPRPAGPLRAAATRAQPPSEAVQRAALERRRLEPFVSAPVRDAAFDDEVEFAVIERVEATRPDESAEASTALARVQAGSAEPEPAPEKSAPPPAAELETETFSARAPDVSPRRPPAPPDASAPSPAPDPPAPETASAPADPRPAIAPLFGPDTPTIVRAPMPEPRVIRTTWHPDPARRAAEVKLADSEKSIRLREGDALGPLIVVAIEPLGVVFSHAGVELRLPVGGAE